MKTSESIKNLAGAMLDWEEVGRRLRAPFPASDIEWRVQSCGTTGSGPWAMVLAYLDNRAIQNRLDEVVGCEGWSNRYAPGPGGGVLCGISIHGITKWDGADNTAVEPVKGGLSDSMKRAAVQWGIGRYLYDLEATFAECSKNKPKGGGWVKNRSKKPDEQMWWKIPSLPKEFLPSGDKSLPRAESMPESDNDEPQEGDPAGGGADANGEPEWVGKLRECKTLADLDRAVKGLPAAHNIKGGTREMDDFLDKVDKMRMHLSGK